MKKVLIVFFIWPILFIGQTPTKNSCWKKESYEKYNLVEIEENNGEES